jgi:hypothetical protein
MSGETIKPKPTLIGLTGYAGAGKDTVRAILERMGYRGMAFADPMRAMLRALLAPLGLGDEWLTHRDLKEQPIPGLGVSYRQLAQTLGTEWARHQRADFWLQVADRTMAQAMLTNRSERDVLFVVSDVRFSNEAQWLRERGGVIWRIERPGCNPVRDHVSETGMAAIKADKTLLNDGSMDHLQHLVEWHAGELAAPATTPPAHHFATTNLALLDALGIPGDMATDVTVRIRPNRLPTATVRRFFGPSTPVGQRLAQRFVLMDAGEQP